MTRGGGQSITGGEGDATLIGGADADDFSASGHEATAPIDLSDPNSPLRYLVAPDDFPGAGGYSNAAPREPGFWGVIGDFFSDLGDRVGLDGHWGFDHTREQREQARLDHLRFPTNENELSEITIWAPRPDGQGYDRLVPYSQLPERSRPQASASAPYSYWGNVGQNVAHGWTSAWDQFRRELGPPTSVDEVFRRSTDPMGTRYVTGALNLALAPAHRGISAMAAPYFRDHDGMWASIENNREH